MVLGFQACVAGVVLRVGSGAGLASTLPARAGLTPKPKWCEVNKTMQRVV